MAEGEDTKVGLSRRSMLGGVAAAGAALSAAGAVVLPEVASAVGGQVAVAPKGTTAIELVMRIDQHLGVDLTGYGFLTDVFGLVPNELFFSEPENEGSAVFTAFAKGTVQASFVVGSAPNTVHSLDVVGGLTVYHRNSPGASFSDPDSFQVGTPVAHYNLTIQDILTVITPGTGLPTLLGDLQQDKAGSLGPGHGKFGKVGLQLRMTGAGFGKRSNTDPSPPEAVLDIAGNLQVV